MIGVMEKSLHHWGIFVRAAECEKELKKRVAASAFSIEKSKFMAFIISKFHIAF
jgi:hypothetical protein